MTQQRAVEILFGSRHPFQIYMLMLCLVSGFPLILGKVQAESIEAQLPGWGATAWGLALVGGALVALIGIFMPNRVNGLLIEGIGLVSVGAAAVIYAIAIIATVGFGGIVAAGITLGFGLSCIVRWFQLNAVLATFTPDH